MPLSIFVDPGAKVAGVAVFEDGELSSAWLSKGTDWYNTAWRVVEDLKERYPYELIYDADVAIEIPQVYHQSKLKGDPNDLITISLMGAAFVGLLGFERDRIIETYHPREWKGQVPKNIMTKRIESKLSADERARVELPRAKDLQHNVWDAVGIGQYHHKKGRHKHANRD